MRGRLPLGLLLLVTLLASGCSAPFRMTVKMDRAELQARARTKFPISRRVSVAKVSLSNPVVLLNPFDNRIGLEMDAAVDLVLIQIPGKIGVVGDLEYDSDTKKFYLHDPELTRIELPELSEREEAAIKEAIEDVVQDDFPRIPVYELKDGSARMFVRSVKVKEGLVVVEMGL